MSHYTIKLDVPDDVRRTAISLLNQQLADILDLGLQAKQAHWNVKGPEFISLHEFFDSVAETVEEFADLIAERVVQLGGQAAGTIQAISSHSRLPVYKLDLHRGQDHLKALATSMAHFAASVRAGITSASNAGEADTADVMTQVSRGIDSLLWKVASHIPEAWGMPADGRVEGIKPPASPALSANIA